MAQLSRQAFIRLVVVGTWGALLGSGGCSDGAMRASGLRRPYPYEDEEEDRDSTEATATKQTKSAGVAEGDGEDAGAMTEAVDPVDPQGGAVDAGVDGAPAPAPVNVCLQNLALSEAAGITSGHAHSFTIPAADFVANAERTYTMAGGHAHTVTITAAQFAMLRAGGTVNVTSGLGNAHTHAVAIKCA